MGFNPLWINTALKHIFIRYLGSVVSIPYGLTLLSNKNSFKDGIQMVSIPYGLTLLSNQLKQGNLDSMVSIPYGLTLLSNRAHTPLLHYIVSIPYGLTLLSNRISIRFRQRKSFNPLWINTALKLHPLGSCSPYSFNPLWINTALKPQIRENDLHIAVLFLRKFYLKLYFT